METPILQLLGCEQMNHSLNLHLGSLKSTPVSSGSSLQKQTLDRRGAKAMPGAFGCLPALLQLSQEKCSMWAAAASRQNSSVPPLSSRTKRFWMKWEKRISKCFPTPSSLWIQGQSAHLKFSFHLDIFRMRWKFKNQKMVQKIYLTFIRIYICKFGDQFLDIFLTCSWVCIFFSVLSWGNNTF